MNRNKKLLLLIVVAALLRLFHLGSFSLWLDEYTSIEVATKSLADIVQGRGFDSHTPPFYYVVLNLYFSLLAVLNISISEFTLRLPSVVFDLCSIVLLYSVAKRFFAESTAFLSAVLYSLLEYPIFFAQEGRMYSLLALECLLVLRLLLPLSELTLIKAALLTLTTICGLYTHYYFAFFTMGVGLALLFDYRAKGFVRALIAFFFAGIGFIPWVAVVLKLASSGGQTFREFTLVSIPYSVFRFLAGYAVFPLDSITKANQLEAVKGSILILLAYGLLSTILLLLGLYALRRTKSYFYFLFPLLTSSIIPLLISIKTPMFSERYLSGVMPIICILFALALESLAGNTKKMAQAALSLSLVYSLFCHYGGEPRFNKEQWRDVVALLREKNLNHQVYIEPDFIKPILSFYCPECQVLVASNFPLPPESVLVRRGSTTRLVNLEKLKVISFPAESGLFVESSL